jgi:predicted MFS family arabinose efflux permease
VTAGAKTDRRWRVIAAVGIIQVLAWGSSYYLLAVLAGPIARDTGWSYPWVIAGVSLGLLVAGAVSIRVGRTIEEFGGRRVLAASALLFAAGLAVMAMAPVVPIYLAAWVLLGAGMGAGLYDAAFSTLGRLYGAQARSAITQLTLWGGFASTVCWPLSAWLVEAVGWRGACLAYAGLHLVVTLPLALFAIPRESRRELVTPQTDAAVLPSEALANRTSTVLLLAAILTAAGVVAAIWSVHLITILQAGGVGLASAVALGALVGPAQVGARVIEKASGGRHHPIWTLATAAVLIAAGLALLWAGVGLLAVALIAYGAGNGIWSIARGTLPLTLFGPQGYAVLMGRLAMPSLIAQALAPSAGALLLQRYGAQATLAALAGLALLNLVGVAALWVLARPRAAQGVRVSP